MIDESFEPAALKIIELVVEGTLFKNHIPEAHTPAFPEPITNVYVATLLSVHVNPVGTIEAAFRTVIRTSSKCPVPPVGPFAVPFPVERLSVPPLEPTPLDHALMTVGAEGGGAPAL